MITGVNVAPMTVTLVMSIHDVAPATADQTRQWCADADALGIPVSLLVIPGRWRGGALAEDADYAAELRSRRAGGDDIVMHGFEHVASPGGSIARRGAAAALARGAGEFATLDRERAAHKIAAAAQIMADSGLATTGFTPPGWLASAAAETALTDAGFRYTTNHWGLKDLQMGRLHRGFALSHRPVGGWTERVAATMMDRLSRVGGLVRIAAHPDDLSRPGLRDVTLRAVERLLDAGARAATYAEVIAR